MTRRKSVRQTGAVALPAKGITVLLADVRELIVQAREGAARAVDAGLTTLYWHVGQRIRQDILKQKRAEYGEQIVSALSTQLEQEYGRGFGTRNLFRMVRFAEVFPGPKGLRISNVCTSNCHGVEVSSSSHRGIGRAQG